VTAAERAARCTWIRYLDDLIECAPEDIQREAVRESIVAFNALSDEERTAHVAWRREVHEALEETLQKFCPGGDPSCCDEKFWPKPKEGS
jgi:hypothetical protein